jgi:hypothetical protein
MSTPSSPGSHTPNSNKDIEFLKSIDLDTILQQLVRDALDAKPDDALSFAAEWTRKRLHQRNRENHQQHAAATGNNSPLTAIASGVTDGKDSSTPPVSARSDGGPMNRRSSDNVLKSHTITVKTGATVAGSGGEILDVNDPQSVVTYTWKARTQDEPETFLLEFCDLALNVLFSQHPSLKRVFIEDIGLTTEAAAESLAMILHPIVYKKASPEEVAKKVMQAWKAFVAREDSQANKTVQPSMAVMILWVRQRHFHYLMCAILYAVECIVTRATWKQIGTDWLKIIGDAVQACQNAVFDEQIVVASTISRESLDNEYEQSMVLTTTSLDRQTPVDIVKGIWLGMTAAQQEKICRKFFAVLFTQHRTVIRFFVDEDKESAEGDSLVDRAPTKELQVILTQVLRGFLSLEGISKMAARHLAGQDIPQRYLHYGLSCMLTALGLELGAKRMDAKVSEAWRVFITRLLDAVAQGIEEAKYNDESNKPKEGGDENTNNNNNNNKAKSSGCSQTVDQQRSVSQQVDSGLKLKIDDANKLDHFSSSGHSPFSIAAECWTALRERNSATEISEIFFNILFTQHPMLAKTILKNNSEYSELIAFLPSLFSEVCHCEISDTDLREMGARLTGRGIDEQKADHVVAAAMSVFAIQLGMNVFREREEALQTVVRFITDNILYGSQNSVAVLAARAPEVIVLECWNSIVDKQAVIKKALEVMKIQHRSLTRDLLDGVEDDMDGFLKMCVDFVAGVLTGKIHDEEIQRVVGKLKAKCEEKQRPIDKKFITYFCFSFQSAVGIILGTSRFETVSHHWTSQVEKANKKITEMM